MLAAAAEVPFTRVDELLEFVGLGNAGGRAVGADGEGGGDSGSSEAEAEPAQDSGDAEVEEKAEEPEAAEEPAPAEPVPNAMEMTAMAVKPGRFARLRMP